MNTLKLKVCGMRVPENIEGLLEVVPDFIGFIFYPKSSRYVGNMEEHLIDRIPSSIRKVGVFVNETIENVLETVSRYNLDYVQLHGDEDLEYAMRLKEHELRVIKVFSVSDELPEDLHAYEGIVDYLLFDTRSKNYGGSGKQFDWNILTSKEISVPFFLSGGIGLEDVDQIKSLHLPELAAIDVNSKFEIEPGLKDLERIRELRSKL